jgi:hypothetical protein
MYGRLPTFASKWMNACPCQAKSHRLPLAQETKSCRDGKDYEILQAFSEAALGLCESMCGCLHEAHGSHFAAALGHRTHGLLAYFTREKASGGYIKAQIHDPLYHLSAVRSWLRACTAL